MGILAIIKILAELLPLLKDLIGLGMKAFKENEKAQQDKVLQAANDSVTQFITRVQNGGTNRITKLNEPPASDERGDSRT